MVPDENIVLGGAGLRRALTVTAIGSGGTATVTATVDDGQATGSIPIEVEVGTIAQDALTGGADADMIFVRKGNDTASGQGANDLLCGGDGKDTLRGGEGADTMRGGEDNDRLRGGPGADSFGGGSWTDKAADFAAGEGDTKNNIERR